MPNRSSKKEKDVNVLAAEMLADELGLGEDSVSGGVMNMLVVVEK